jgi:hypothetical protein
MIFITLYLFGVIGVCIVSYFDYQNGHGKVSLIGGASMSLTGLIVFAYGLWVLKEEMRYSRERCGIQERILFLIKRVNHD